MPKKQLKVSKGDIFVLTNLTASGHEQNGLRPHVVVTRVNEGVVTVAPCTTSTRIRKYSVLITPDTQNHLHQNSYVLIAQAFAVDISFLSAKIGQLDESDILRIQLECVKYFTD